MHVQVLVQDFKQQLLFLNTGLRPIGTMLEGLFTDKRRMIQQMTRAGLSGQSLGPPPHPRVSASATSQDGAALSKTSNLGSFPSHDHLNTRGAKPNSFTTFTIRDSPSPSPQPNRVVGCTPG